MKAKNATHRIVTMGEIVAHAKSEESAHKKARKLSKKDPLQQYVIEEWRVGCAYYAGELVDPSGLHAAYKPKRPSRRAAATKGGKAK